jgi:hypothetical protein
MVAGYDTQAGGGTGYIAWTPQQYARHTKPYPALHIDQDAGASDYLADLLDVETNAATQDEIVRWITNARIEYEKGTRKGQRWPGIYCSESNVPGAVSVLHNANIGDVPFTVANYNLSPTEAQRRVSIATGPYPAYGYQYGDQAFNSQADFDVWAVKWLTSWKPTVTPPPVQEEDVISGILGPKGTWAGQQYRAFPAGSAKELILYKDFVGGQDGWIIRVAIHSKGSGYSVNQHPITNALPVVIPFSTNDVDAVSLRVDQGPANEAVSFTVA